MDDLEQFRSEKDEFYRTDPHSPLKPGQRQSFTGLNYYPPAPALAFTIELDILPDPGLVEMQTSTGDTATFLRWATITFDVEGTSATLTVYRDPGTNGLFLPFQDANAGAETYGAGRYLEVEELPGGRLLVDFNYAYNPYCAYNEDWSCPIPLPENRLRIPIRAGEKSFDH